MSSNNPIFVIDSDSELSAYHLDIIRSQLLIALLVVPVLTWGQYEYFNNVYWNGVDIEVCANILVEDSTYSIFCQQQVGGPQNLLFRKISVGGEDLGSSFNEISNSTGFFTHQAESIIQCSNGDFAWAGYEAGTDIDRGICLRFDDSIFEDDIVWEFGFDSDSIQTTEFYIAFENSEESLFAVGAKHQNVDDDPFLDFSNLFIVKIGLDGVVLWQSEIDLGFNLFINVSAMKELPTGGYLLFGSVSPDIDNFICQITEQGDLDWIHTWGTEGIDDGYLWPVAMNDTDFMVAYKSGTQSSSLVSSGYPHLALFQSETQQITNDIEYPYFMWGCNVQDLIKCPGGGYCILGNSSEDSFSDTYSWIIKTDSLGNEEWFRKYYHMESQPGQFAILNSLYDIELGLDGGYICAGYFRDINAVDWPTKSWVLKLDACGDVEWEGC
jgi:hypothetical protein